MAYIGPTKEYVNAPRFINTDKTIQTKPKQRCANGVYYVLFVIVIVGLVALVISREHSFTQRSVNVINHTP